MSSVKPDITRVLLVYYYFPPYAAGGSYRPAKMAKYLPAFHIGPTIICADKIPYRPIDEDIAADVPRHLDIKRVPVRFENSAYYRLMYKLGCVPSLNARIKPETTIKWTNDVLPLAKRLMDEKGIGTFLVSAPPSSLVVLGTKLKEKTGKRFILEYRDPWTQGPFYKPPREGLRGEFERMEEDALRAADAVVMVTDTFAKLMIKRWPFLVDKIHVAPNGYDQDDLPKELLEPVGWSEKFVLAYAGSIYSGYHTDVFLDGLKLWFDKNPEAKVQTILSYMGFMDRRAKNYIDKSGLSEIVEWNGYLHHRGAVAMISSADLLILALPDVPNAGGHISAKIYEYMASGKPVLASLPDGEMSRLVEESRCGWVVPPDKPEAIADKLEFLLKLHREGALVVSPDAEYVGRFTRRKAAEKLAEVIRGLK